MNNVIKWPFKYYDGFLYLIVFDKYCKAGGTKRNPEERFSEHVHSRQFDLFGSPKLYGQLKCKNIWLSELFWHGLMDKYAFNAKREIFEIDPELAMKYMADAIDLADLSVKNTKEIIRPN